MLANYLKDLICNSVNNLPLFVVNAINTEVYIGNLVDSDTALPVFKYSIKPK